MTRAWVQTYGAGGRLAVSPAAGHGAGDSEAGAGRAGPRQYPADLSDLTASGYARPGLADPPEILCRAACLVHRVKFFAKSFWPLTTNLEYQMKYIYETTSTTPV